ncbi:hypothetical protein HY229_07440 [Candidatus Acetothermia bacterium]|nr:hypothetical protein [Candidatus Acetothermia bacterium]MBI3643912.1 hypothetical protein [Candidatus Acetothermia bacterium]
MFLAKVWKTASGKKYEAWVLKKGVWDKIEKRYRQVYLAYVGTTTKITHERAAEICTKLGVPLGELKRVRRLKIADGESILSQIEAPRASLLSQEPGVTFSPSSTNPEGAMEPLVQLDFREEKSVYSPALPVFVVTATLLRETQIEESSAVPVGGIASLNPAHETEQRLEAEFQEQLLILPPTSPGSVSIPELQAEPQVGLKQPDTVLSEPIAVSAAAVIGPPQGPDHSSSVEVAQPHQPSLSLSEAAELVRKLREQFGLSRTLKGYEELAMRVGVLRVNARELRRTEEKENTLMPSQAGWLEKMLQSMPRRRIK